MATEEAIVFEGRRWTGAGIASSSWGPILRASGRPRAWNTDTARAFWRNLTAVQLPDPREADTTRETEQLMALFVARHGDPVGELDRLAAAGEPLAADTSGWGLLIDPLRLIAGAWDDPDKRGVSHMTSDKARIQEADRALRRLLPADPDGDRVISSEIEVAYTGQGLTLRPQTLRAFMVLSAASARERGIAMRRCAYCDDWFELGRVDARYCSGSCQATHHKRRETLAEQNRGQY